MDLTDIMREVEMMFDVQLSRLEEKGVFSLRHLATLRRRRAEAVKIIALSEICHLYAVRHYIPFLFVVPPTIKSTGSVAKRVFVGDQRLGHKSFHGKITDFVQVPDKAYIAYNVSLGVSDVAGPETIGREEEDAEAIIASTGFSPLTLHEGVCLMLQWPSVFDRSGLRFLGSRSFIGSDFWPKGLVPALYVNTPHPLVRIPLYIDREESQLDLSGWSYPYCHLRK